MRLALVLAAMAGAAQAASFAPFEWWGLQILSLALLAWLVRGRGPRQAALLGGAFGLAWFGAGLWWLYISLHQHGGLAPPLAVAALVLLGAFLSLYPAGAMALLAWARARAPGWAAALLFAGCWTLGELARASWFTGFPWIAGGYAHTVGPLAAWAPWIGVYGIGWLAALIAGLCAQARERVWALLPALALMGVGLALPQGFTRAGASLGLSLLQPNVAQSTKFDPALMAHNRQALLAQIQAARGELVVTPESVLPIPFALMTPEQQAPFIAASHGRALLLGTFVREPSGWVNTMVGWRDGLADYRYGKRHLLPFGEFIPPGLEWFVRALKIPMDSQAEGDHQRPWTVGGLRLRPLICYEDLFGEDIVASALDGPEAAELFVNTSNLAWFGATLVLDQHLQFSQMRALEFQRPVVRATNTGATAWVDHRGRLQARLPAEQAGVLELRVQGRLGSTPYARWLGRFGLAPLWIWAMGALALVPLGRRAG